MILGDNVLIDKLIIILFEKGILAIAILLAGYIIKKSIEQIKSNEMLNNEIIKIRTERITEFYDLISEYEHWINRLVNHVYYQIKNDELYLTESEFEEARKKADEISNTISFKLNKMRFWINDDIYFHTVAQLEILKEIQNETIINRNVDLIKELRFKNDTFRMNIERLLSYLRDKPNIRKVKYDRSFLYK